MKPVLSLNLIMLLSVQIWSCGSFKVTSIDVPGPIKYFENLEVLGAFVHAQEFSLYLYHDNDHCVAFVLHSDYNPVVVLNFEATCPTVTDLRGRLDFVKEKDTYKMGLRDKETDPWTTYTIPRNIDPTKKVNHKLDDLEKKQVEPNALDWIVPREKDWKVNQRPVIQKSPDLTGEKLRASGPMGEKRWTFVQRKMLAMSKIAMALRRSDEADMRNLSAMERMVPPMEKIAKTYHLHPPTH